MCLTHSVQSIIIREVIHHAHHMSLRETEVGLYQHTSIRKEREGRERGRVEREGRDVVA